MKGSASSIGLTVSPLACLPYLIFRRLTYLPVRDAGLPQPGALNYRSGVYDDENRPVIKHHAGWCLGQEDQGITNDDDDDDVPPACTATMCEFRDCWARKHAGPIQAGIMKLCLLNVEFTVISPEALEDFLENPTQYDNRFGPNDLMELPWAKGMAAMIQKHKQTGINRAGCGLYAEAWNHLNNNEPEALTRAVIRVHPNIKAFKVPTPLPDILKPSEYPPYNEMDYEGADLPGEL